MFLRSVKTGWISVNALCAALYIAVACKLLIDWARSDICFQPKQFVIGTVVLGIGISCASNVKKSTS